MANERRCETPLICRLFLETCPGVSASRTSSDRETAIKYQRVPPIQRSTQQRCCGTQGRQAEAPRARRGAAAGSCLGEGAAGDFRGDQGRRGGGGSSLGPLPSLHPPSLPPPLALTLLWRAIISMRRQEGHLLVLPSLPLPLHLPLPTSFSVPLPPAHALCPSVSLTCSRMHAHAGTNAVFCTASICSASSQRRKRWKNQRG